MFGFDLARLRDHRLNEAMLGFPLLRGCPSTSAIRLIIQLDALSESGRQDFAGQLSSLDELQAARPPATNAELGDMIRSFPLVADFYGRTMGLVPPGPAQADVRTMPVKLLANVLKEVGPEGWDAWLQGLALSSDPAARLPDGSHVSSLAEAVPVEPRRLRKLVDEAMLSHWGAVPLAIGKGHVRYEATRPDGRFRVDLLTAPPGTMRHQFDYSITAERPGRPDLRTVAYETVWRLPARWDCVTEANAPRSAAHLGALVAACLALA